MSLSYNTPKWTMWGLNASKGHKLKEMFEVILLSKAEKYYKKCDTVAVKRLNQCFENMENDPFTYGTVKPLQSKFKNVYRARIGSLRVIFHVDKENNKVYIIDIGPRGNIYK